LTRRRFLGTAAPAAAAPALALGQQATPPSRRLRVAVVGLSRGVGHIKALAQVDGVEIAAVCDVDAQRLAAGAAEAEKATGARPQAVGDFRRLLDDREIDAVTIAAPNFWHTPMTVLACQAGKHVYVEKPGSACGREAELVVEAARRHGRQVQMGNQRRSLPALIEAAQRLREGAIGTLRHASCYYTSQRGSIGRGKPAPVPAHLDYDLWQGPVPRRPYVDNLVHYDWHWRWHWGNGELGNNGVHALDIARWFLGVSLPRSVAFAGARCRYDDDQETPDTGVATFTFEHAVATWDCTSCYARKHLDTPFVAVDGDGGSLVTDGSDSYQLFDPDGNPTGGRTGAFSDVPHFQNFADAVREGTPLNAEIADAQVSATLCHLGNAAYRSASVLQLEPGQAAPAPGHPAAGLWARAYEPGWEVGA
jgi:predicted dehydrogenase